MAYPAAHSPQHDLLPPQQAPGRVSGTQLARVDDGARQQRRFLSRQLRGTLAEVGARRRFAAEDAVAPLDHVQVDLENPALAEAGLEPPRDEQLAQLAHGNARRRQVEVLRQLLGDGAGAAREAAILPVAFERGLDLVEVDAVVIEERGVLRDDHRALQMRRDLPVGHPAVADAELALLRLRLSHPQFHERRGLRVLLRKHPDVWQGQVDVDDVAEGKGCRSQQATPKTPHLDIIAY